MTTSPRYLDEKLSPVIDPEKARFEETDLFLRLYSADVFDDVATLYKEDVGSGPSWKGAVVFANGDWHETLDKQGVSFQKTQIGWTAVLGKQSVTILPDCDPRDAATWLTSFLQITKSSTGVGKIQLLENAEFVLVQCNIDIGYVIC